MIRLAHLSDPHLGPLPAARLRDLLSKRAIGYVNWHRSRARAMTGAWLDGLLNDLQAASPDHIALTGDLVNIALDREISAAADWLETVGKPADVSLVPGNHDAYVQGALKRAKKAWGPYMTGDDEEKPGFPYVRRARPACPDRRLQCKGPARPGSQPAGWEASRRGACVKRSPS